MRIIVLSDTHMPRRAKALPRFVLLALENADHIIHTGDFTAPEAYELLRTYAPVTAVAGNADPPELRNVLGERKLLRLNGFTLGICHGHGSRGTTIQRAIAAFAGDSVDAVVFGHSHIAYCAYHNGVLMLNPGSPTDKRRSPYFSYGVIGIGETLSARIVYFDKDGTEMRMDTAPDC